ncbi:MAG: CoA activase [Deltaproteobacteria bacterium]|nr:CoA activase [Deltaproteobacteria bacterium]
MDAKAATPEFFSATLPQNPGRIPVGRKTLLIPEMNRIASHLVAATFRGFGVTARVLGTYQGLDLGKEYTSGKECFPCQITLGDILYFMEKEKEGLGAAFDPAQYAYFLPESDGPCRFGLYSKFQRIVLDTLPGLQQLKITSVTTKDGYLPEGMIGPDKVLDLRKVAYFSFVVSDILDRLLWRIRPYEKEVGMADAFIEKAMETMEHAFERFALHKEFDRILDRLQQILQGGKEVVNPAIPPKPLVGVVGEIYLRMHSHANQNLIRMLEKYGAEVVNASMTEWVNYVSYDGLRGAKAEFLLYLKQCRFRPMIGYLKGMLAFGLDLLYQEHTQNKVYKRIHKIMDLPEDHKISHLEHILNEDDLYSFDIATEACLSIASIIACARAGYNGMVNVYPFTCMPSTTTAAIVKPYMNRLGIPYLDAPYDSSIQPGREAALRTFMYQAEQHFKHHGRTKSASPH